MPISELAGTGKDVNQNIKSVTIPDHYNCLCGNYRGRKANDS